MATILFLLALCGVLMLLPRNWVYPLALAVAISGGLFNLSAAIQPLLYDSPHTFRQWSNGIEVISFGVIAPHALLVFQTTKRKSRPHAMLFVSAIGVLLSGFFTYQFLISNDPSRGFYLPVAWALIWAAVVVALLVPKRPDEDSKA